MTAVGSVLRGPAVVGTEVDDPDAATTADLDAVDDRRRSPDRSSPPPSEGRWFTSPAVVLPLVVGVLAAVLVVSLVKADGAGGPGPGEAIVTVKGAAFVARADGTSESVLTGESVRLHPGDRIDVRRGVADLQLAKGVSYQALARRGRTPDTSIAMAATPTLRAGEVLVRAPQDPARLAAGVADVQVTHGGVARIVRSYAVTVGSYRGTSVLTSAGMRGLVPPLRSLQAAAAGELAGRRPLDIRGDAWDRLYLADALALDRQLGPLARGMRAGKVAPAQLLEAVRVSLRRVPGRSQVVKLVEGRPSRLDLGIGLAVIANGTRDDLARRWERGVRFRDDGATWGLVAMDLAAAPDDVIGTLRDAIDDGGLTVAGADGAGGFSGIGDEAAGTAGIDLLGGAGADGTTSGPGGSSDPLGTGSDPGSDGTTPGGTGVTVPGVTTPGGITVPTTPGGVGTPTIPGVTTPSVTTPAVPAVPVVPGVTTPSLPPVDIPNTVSSILGSVTTLLPALTTTTRGPAATTTTTKPLLGCVIPGLCI